MSDREPSAGAVGWIMFAGFVMIISGGFGMLQGLGMVINGDQFPGSDAVFSQRLRNASDRIAKQTEAKPKELLDVFDKLG